VSLLADLAAAGDVKSRCTTCITLNDLPEKESEALDTAIHNRDISIARIVAACEKNGVKVNKNSLDNHRQGRCPKR